LVAISLSFAILASETRARRGSAPFGKRRKLGPTRTT
jgi:hypothetical protein